MDDDYAVAGLRVGGQVADRGQLERLLGVVEAAGLRGSTWGAQPSLADGLRAAVQVAVRVGQPLTLVSVTSESGVFPEPERLLDEAGLPYDRWSDGWRVSVRPGSPPVESLCDDAGDPLVPLDRLEEDAAQGRSLQTVLSRVRRSLPPPLPPLTLGFDLGEPGDG